MDNVVCPVKKLTSSFLRCDLTEGIEKHNLLTSKAILTITVCINKNSFNFRVYSWWQMLYDSKNCLFIGTWFRQGNWLKHYNARQLVSLLNVPEELSMKSTTFIPYEKMMIPQYMIWMYDLFFREGGSPYAVLIESQEWKLNVCFFKEDLKNM